MKKLILAAQDPQIPHCSWCKCHHHGDDVSVESCVRVNSTFCTILPYLENLRGGSFLSQPNPYRGKAVNRFTTSGARMRQLIN